MHLHKAVLARICTIKNRISSESCLVCVTGTMVVHSFLQHTGDGLARICVVVGRAGVALWRACDQVSTLLSV